MDCTSGTVAELWNPADNLPPRIKKLRDEYFSFYTRDHFRNEVQAFSHGTPWDCVWAIHQWAIVPEILPFHAAMDDSLQAAADILKMPPGFWNLPLPVRRAKFFLKVLRERLPVQILDGELIVGAQFNTALSKSHTRGEAKHYHRRKDAWIKRLKEMDSLGIGNCGAVPGHLIPNYRKIIEKGFEGVAREIRHALPSRNDGNQRAQLEAMLESCEAGQELARRYSDEAARLAKLESDPARAAELKEIARVCGRVPWNPPETLQEALQSLWITHMLVMAEESYPGPGVSFGRIDQYLFPFFKRDLDEGRLTREQAKELLMCFFIKPNYAYDYQGRVGSNQGINSGFGQLITLGGLGPKGEDLTNGLTWLMLEVIEELNMLEPKPNIRLHGNTPPELLERVCRMLARAQGAPFLLNFDEASMRGLEWQGVPKDKLWDYAPVGCLENTLQGNDRSGTVDINLNLAKAVEYALNDGCDMASGKRIGPRTGNPADFKTFDAFYEAFNRQLDSLVDFITDLTEEADEIRATFEPTPYLSVLVDGCLEKGVDITAGGSEWSFITVEGISFGTVVDSLAAVKTLVYDLKKITMEELLRAIKDNFDGHEKLRTMLQNRAPKYGTDDDAVDALAREVNARWTRHCFRRTTKKTGKRFRGGYLSWNYWISYAPKTAATPDGRPRGSFLSNGIGPVNGMDRKGPTANIRSVGKVGLESAPNGASHTMSINPSLLRDPEHLEKLGALLRAYVDQGGTALQVNVLDPDTLRKAQKNPEEYRNLLVRVTGYNAYFVNLGREIQDEIIARESGILS